MPRTTLMTVLAVLALLPVGSALSEPEDDGHRVVYRTSGDYEFVRESVAAAITNQGLVITNASNVGEMLERTGKDLGQTTRVYGQAELLEFCSAIYSRRAMEADIHNIVFCPYRLAVYTEADDPETVYVSFARMHTAAGPKAQESLQAVESLLRSMIEEALE